MHVPPAGEWCQWARHYPRGACRQIVYSRHRENIGAANWTARHNGSHA
jgi:hypothetical protein